MGTRTPGSEGGPGKRTDPKGRQRAPARPYWAVLEDAFDLMLVNARHVKQVDRDQQVTLACVRLKARLDLGAEAADRFVEEVDVREDLPDDQGVLGLRAPTRASRNAGIFARNRPRARSASTSGSFVPATSR